jgi:3-oxoacyl-[acyl-carrier protein] reductase
MDLGLLGARVLVTAASRGLGAATAKRFSLEGARVIISSRQLDKLQETAAAIVEASGNPVFTMAADMTDPAAVKRLITNTVETLGGLDIIVANAGGPPAGTFDKFDLEAWQSAVNLNLMSTISLIKEALPHLRESSRAAILTITSTSAKQPIDNLILSNTVRPAVLGLTKSLSLELGPEGIRVNSILPGTTDTVRVNELMSARSRANNTTVEEERDKTAQSTPLRRIGTPEEFANAAVFLCSPAAGFITGVSLPVDGGAIRATM